MRLCTGVGCASPGSPVVHIRHLATATWVPPHPVSMTCTVTVAPWICPMRRLPFSITLKVTAVAVAVVVVAMESAALVTVVANGASPEGTPCLRYPSAHTRMCCGSAI